MKIKVFVLFCFLSIFSDSVLSQNGIPETDWIFVKGGKFLYGNKKGDDDEKPANKIKINDFYIGKYEVTNSEFCTFLNSVKPEKSLLRKYIDLNGRYKNVSCRIFAKDSVYYVEKGYEDYPVIFVSWFGAAAYCKFVGGRLPSEAEWEYAAKGGKHFFKFNYKKYAGGDNPEEVAFYGKNSAGNPQKKGRKKPNKIGVYDMSGNVSEWCNDWYSPDYYKNLETINPPGPDSGRMKVHRGGSWYNSEKMIRITNRRASKPVTENSVIGFRAVKDIAVFCPVNK